MTTKAKSRISRRTLNRVLTGLFILAALLYCAGINIDVQDQTLSEVLTLWLLLGFAVFGSAIVALTERHREAPHGTDALYSMFSAGAVFFVALYASTTWPSQGLVFALCAAAVTLGGGAVILRLYIREEEEQRREIAKRNEEDVAKARANAEAEVRRLITLLEASLNDVNSTEARPAARSRVAEAWNILVHGVS